MLQSLQIYQKGTGARVISLELLHHALTKRLEEGLKPMQRWLVLDLAEKSQTGMSGLNPSSLYHTNLTIFLILLSSR